MLRESFTTSLPEALREDEYLVYFGARYYDSKIGRFITKDPLTWGPDDPRVLSTPNQSEPFKGLIFQNRGVLNPDTIMNAFNPLEN